MIKNIRLHTKNIILTCVLIVIAGCQQVYYISLADITNHEKPTFCVSKYPSCIDSVSSIEFISIAEVDDFGNYIKDVWVIKKIANSDIKQFTYGVAPDGWLEVKPATSIELNKWYFINALYYFKITIEDGTNKSVIYDLNEFSEHVKSTK